jgi:translation initiation factor IF-2
MTGMIRIVSVFKSRVQTLIHTRCFSNDGSDVIKNFVKRSDDGKPSNKMNKKDAQSTDEYKKYSEPAVAGKKQKKAPSMDLIGSLKRAQSGEAVTQQTQAVQQAQEKSSSSSMSIKNLLNKFQKSGISDAPAHASSSNSNKSIQNYNNSNNNNNNNKNNNQNNKNNNNNNKNRSGGSNFASAFGGDGSGGASNPSSKFSQQRTTAEIGPTSVRNVFRQAAEANKNKGGNQNQNQGQKSKDILKNFKASTSQVHEEDQEEYGGPELIMQSAANIEDSEGNLRYRQHEQKMKWKAEQSNRISHESPPRYWNKAPGHESSSQEKSRVDVTNRSRYEHQKQERAKLYQKNTDGSMMMSASDYRKHMQQQLASRRRSGDNINNDHDSMNDNKMNMNIKMPNKKGTVVKTILIPEIGLSIRELGQRLSLRIDDIVKKLRDLGESVDVGQDKKTKSAKGAFALAGNDKEEIEVIEIGDIIIDAEISELLVLDLDADIEVKREINKTKSDKKRHQEGSNQLETKSRDPVVCVMGHVDHGKTSLLDALRNASVAAGEAGGITQRLSAFRVQVNNKSSTNTANEKSTVVFLDTPGHAAFSTMRSHGVSATDLVVLVVAIDDGVKPQTKEALKTAKESGCQIIVALNKCDKFDHDPEAKREARARVLAQLVEHDLVAEDYGGDTMVVETSALAGAKKNGLDSLIESIALQADIMELKAADKGQCEAVVLDANMEKGRGVVADLLIRWGELSVGDSIVVDTMYGKVKAIIDDKGKKIKKAGPSMPVQVLGLRTVPTAGQEMLSVENETRARQISERRLRVTDLKLQRKNQLINDKSNPNLNQGYYNNDGTFIHVPTVELVLKADGVGTMEALEKVVKEFGLRTTDVNLNIVNSGIGDIARGDIETASTSNAIILGFNVGIADSTTRSMAKEHDVRIARDNIIYRLEEKLKDEMQTRMPLEKIHHSDGIANVQKIFEMNNKTKDIIAGCIVTTGFLTKKQIKGGYPIGFSIRRPGAGDRAMKILKEIENDPTSTGPGGKYNGVAIPDKNDNDLLKNDIVFREETINDDTVTLRRFKDIVSTIENGSECGIALTRFKNWKDGDVIECYRIEMRRKELTMLPP